MDQIMFKIVIALPVIFAFAAGCTSSTTPDIGPSSSDSVFGEELIGLWQRIVTSDMQDEGYLNIAMNGELTTYNYSSDQNCYFIGTELLTPSGDDTYTIAGASPDLPAVSIRFNIERETLSLSQKDIFDTNQDGSTEDYFVDQTLTIAEGIDQIDLNECEG